MLIAVDTNVLIDQALKDPDVLDALAIIRHRIPQAQFVVTRTVIEELTWLLESEPETEAGSAALTAIMCMVSWGYQMMDVAPVGRGIVQEIGRKLRAKNIIPDEEENDASIVAESGLIGCKILLTSDAHLLDAQNHDLFARSLKDCDVESLTIAKPSTIARKFDNRR